MVDVEVFCSSAVAFVADVALRTVPVTFAPAIFVRPAPLPENVAPEAADTLPALMLPETVSEVREPIDVIFGWAAVVTVPAVVAEVEVVAEVASGTVPVTFAPVNELNPEPLPVKTPVFAVMFAAVMLPFTVRTDNVPCDVMFG